MKPLLTKDVVPPLILIAQGIEGKTGQLRAGYTDKFLFFTKSLQAIAAPYGKINPDLFKILTAVLRGCSHSTDFLVNLQKKEI